MIYVFEQNMQFLLGGFFCIFWGPYKKIWIEPVDAACFSWSETTKVKKSPKINLRQNSTIVTLLYLNLGILIFIHGYNMHYKHDLHTELNTSACTYRHIYTNICICIIFYFVCGWILVAGGRNKRCEQVFGILGFVERS